MATEAELKVRLSAEPDAAKTNAAAGRLKQLLLGALGGGVKASADVDAGRANSALGKLRELAARTAQAVTGMAAEGTSATRQLGSGFDDANSRASRLNQTLSSVKNVMAAGAVAGGLLAGLGGAAKAAVTANAEFETLETQLATAIKGSEDFKLKYATLADPVARQAAAVKEAKGRMVELNQFGASTPFDLPGIGKAEKTLIGFGLTGQRAMRLTGKSAGDLRTIVGDVAAGTGADYNELAVTLGKFSTGATGEAISRLQELGIATKEELAGMGVQFDKAGSLVSPVDKALTTATTIMQQKFGGGMAELSKTFSGQLSTLKDGAEAALRTLGAPIFESLRGAIGQFNEVLGSDAVQGAISKVGEAIAPIAGLLTGTLAKLLPAISSLLGPIADTMTTLLGPVTEIIGAVVGSLADLITGIAGPLGALLTTLGATVVSLIQPLIGALMPAIGSVVQILSPLIGLIANLAAAVVPLVQVALLPMTSVLGIVAQVAAQVLGAFAPLIAGLLQFAADLVADMLPAINAVVGLIGEFAALFGDVLATAISLGVRLLAALTSGLGAAAGGLATTASKGGALKTALDFVKTAVSKVAEGFQFLKGVMGGLRSAFDEIKSTIDRFLEALSSFNISDALKAFSGFGDRVASAYKKGFQQATAAVQETKEAASTPPEPPPAPPAAKKTDEKKSSDESAFQRAKRLFDLEKQRTDTQQKSTELTTEKARIEAGRNKTVIDDVVVEKQRRDVLQGQLATLERLLAVGSSGKIGIRLDAKEIKDAEGLLASTRAAFQEQDNRFAELRLKLIPDVDEEKLRNLERERLKLDVELGARSQQDLVAFLSDDLTVLEKQLSDLTQRRVDDLADARAQGVITEEEHQAALLRVQRQGEEAQLGLQNQIAAKRKELRDIQYDRELRALERKQKLEEDALKRSSELQQRFLDNLFRFTAQAVGFALDRRTKEQLEDLDKLRDRELISEEEFERRRERIEQRVNDPAERLRQLRLLEARRRGELASEEHIEEEKRRVTERAERQRTVLAERLRGQQVEADRQAALQSLQFQREQLAAKQALAKSLGKTEEADEIGLQLDDIATQIETKGSLLKNLTGDLQGALTDGLTNLFSGNTEQVKDPFRRAFSALAGALQRLATAKVTEVLLGALSGLGGIPGLIASFAAKPVIEALIGGVLGPVIDGLLSFSTGGRIDAPTLAVIGDGARLGGGNREWIFRDDQLRSIMQEVAIGSQQALINEMAATRAAMESMAGREWRLSGTDLLAANERTRAARNRRQINGRRRPR